jgi:TonB family protein
VQPEPYVPAALLLGQPPDLPAISVSGGGEVVLELAVSAAGVPTAITVLRSTPPFTDLLTSAVRTWRFDPATVEGAAAPAPVHPDGEPPRTPVPAHVLVVAVVNPPVTIGPTLGDPPVTVTSPSAAVPWAEAFAAPPNSPVAAATATVLVEALVDARGAVSRARIRRSAEPYDAPSLEAVRSWTFRPARRDNRPVPSHVYVVFAFPFPVRNS